MFYGYENTTTSKKFHIDQPVSQMYSAKRVLNSILTRAKVLCRF